MKKYIVLIVFALSAVACGHNSDWEAVRNVENYINDKPDSALAVLKNVDKSVLNSRSRRAQFAVWYAMALDKNETYTKDIDIIMPAVKYYRHYGPVKMKVYSLYYYGVIQYNSGDLSNAIVTFTQIFPLLEKFSNLYFEGNLYSILAEIYNHTGDYRQALDYALKTFQKCSELADSARIDNASYLLAGHYMNARYYDKADSIFQHLFKCSEYCSDPFVISSYAYLLANMDEQQDESLKMFEKALAIKNTLSSGSQWAAYAYTLGASGRIDEAEDIFTQLNKYGDSHGIKYWEYRLKKTEGDYKTACDYLLQYESLLDSAVVKTLSQSISKAQSLYFESRKNEYQAKANNLRLLIFAISLSIIIASLLIYLYFDKQKKEKEKLSLLIDAATEQLRQTENSMIKTYKNQFSFFGSVCETILSTEQGIENGAINAYEQIKTQVSYICDNKEGHALFEQEVNNSMDNIMVHFREDFPALKDKDYFLICCFFAGFSNTLIAIFTGYPSIPAIYTRKYRYKKMISESGSPHKEKYIMLLAQ